MKKLTGLLSVLVTASMMLTGCSGKISNDVITINKYKGLEVEKVTAAEVTDADVEASIQSTLDTLATETEITDRPAQEGDYIVIDFVGKQDGVAFTGGSADDQYFQLGSGGYIPGFEDGIVGHSVGEVFDIEVTFPEEYHSEEMAGQDAVFTITLDQIIERIVPELTDELVASELSSTAKTVEEYRAEEKANLEKSNKESAESEYLSKLWNALLEQCEVEEYPEADVEEMNAEIEAQYGDLASMFQVDVDTLIQQYYQITQQEMVEELLKQQYAIELIAEKENIVLTVEEYEAELEEYATRWGYTSEAMEETLGHDKLESIFMQEKVEEFLYEHSKAV